MPQSRNQRQRNASRTLTLEQLQSRQLLAADLVQLSSDLQGQDCEFSEWHNAGYPTDVNQDGVTSPIDALILINELNSDGSKSLEGISKSDSQSPFVDVNGDLFLTPSDALSVINSLNSGIPYEIDGDNTSVCKTPVPTYGQIQLDASSGRVDIHGSTSDDKVSVEQQHQEVVVRITSDAMERIQAFPVSEFTELVFHSHGGNDNLQVTLQSDVNPSVSMLDGTLRITASDLSPSGRVGESHGSVALSFHATDGTWSNTYSRLVSSEAGHSVRQVYQDAKVIREESWTMTGQYHKTSWHSDGSVSREAYQDDTLVLREEQDNQGSLVRHTWKANGDSIRQTFQDGVLTLEEGWGVEGDSIRKTFSNGTLTREEAWDNQGVQRDTTFGADGSQLSHTYRDGTLILSVQWHPDGKREQTAYAEEGTLKQTFEGDSQTPVSETAWDATGGQRDTTFAEDGSKTRHTYQDGTLVLSEQWHPDGKRERTAYAEEGTLRQTFEGDSQSPISETAWDTKGGQRDTNFAEDGSKTSHTYQDGTLVLFEQWHTDGTRERTAYAEEGTLRQTFEGDGQSPVSETAWDTMGGQRDTIFGADGSKTLHTYQAGTLVLLEQWHSDGKRERTAYAEEGTLRQTFDGDSQSPISESAWDTKGGQRDTTFADDGSKTSYTYQDGTLVLSEQWHADGKRVRTAYAETGRLQQTFEGKGETPVSETAWDTKGGQRDTTFHDDGSKISYTVQDSKHVLTEQWRTNGKRIRTVYSAKGTLQQTFVGDSKTPISEVAWDKDGNDLNGQRKGWDDHIDGLVDWANSGLTAERASVKGTINEWVDWQSGRFNAWWSWYNDQFASGKSWLANAKDTIYQDVTDWFNDNGRSFKKWLNDRGDSLNGWWSQQKSKGSSTWSQVKSALGFGLVGTYEIPWNKLPGWAKERVNARVDTFNDFVDKKYKDYLDGIDGVKEKYKAARKDLDQQYNGLKDKWQGIYDDALKDARAERAKIAQKWTTTFRAGQEVINDVFASFGNLNAQDLDGLLSSNVGNLSFDGFQFEGLDDLGDWGTARWDSLMGGLNDIGDWGTQRWDALSTSWGDLEDFVNGDWKEFDVGQWAQDRWDSVLNGLDDLGDWGTHAWTSIESGWGDFWQGAEDFWNHVEGWGGPEYVDNRTPYLESDSDGDGLLNGWEINGIDINGDGVIDLDLPALGADPNHKDLFVEVDAMFGRDPTAITAAFDFDGDGIADVSPADVVAAGLDSSTSLDFVVAAFLNAPVSNPDEVDGIHLRILVDETNIPLVALPNGLGAEDTNKDGVLDSGEDANGSGTLDGFVEIKAARFGTSTERADSNWNNIRRAKQLVYRYTLFADTHSSSSSSGTGYTPGGDLIVSLGSWNTAGGVPRQQAGTFMHELGHNLGLTHGGVSDVVLTSKLSTGSATVTGISDTSDLYVGMTVSSLDGNVPDGTIINAINGSDSITLSQTASTSITESLYFGPPNYNPNYRGVMNYTWQNPRVEDGNGNGVLDPTEDTNGNGVLDPGEDTNGNGVLDLSEDLNGDGNLDAGLVGWILDYSREDIDLDESNLDESFGLGFTAVVAGTEAWIGAGTPLHAGTTVNAAGAQDFNGDGDMTDTGVRFDLNGDGVIGRLLGQNDWVNIQYAIG